MAVAADAIYQEDRFLSAAEFLAILEGSELQMRRMQFLTDLPYQIILARSSTAKHPIFNLFSKISRRFHTRHSVQKTYLSCSRKQKCKDVRPCLLLANSDRDRLGASVYVCLSFGHATLEWLSATHGPAKLTLGSTRRLEHTSPPSTPSSSCHHNPHLHPQPHTHVQDELHIASTVAA